jgi:hypothetical protein
MFACRIRSLRGLDRVSDDAQFRDNWCTLSRAVTETVVCSKQMTNVVGALEREEVSALRPPLIKELIVRKQIPDAFVRGHLMIGADATGLFSASARHCDQCLTQQHSDGTTTYLHLMLEAKVLTHSGLALSVLSEPLLNPADGRYDKQDCESKAFKRLAPALREVFPRQRLAFLLDSLYANGPTFHLLEDLRAKFIANFKPGSIPTLYDEALTLMRLDPNQSHTVLGGTKAHPIVSVYTWVNGLPYDGLSLDFVMCQETVDGKTTTFTWLTNFPVTRDTVVEIAAAGRLRWKIENEGFNEQKTGYELEHFCGCANLNVMLCLYLLLQIAHLFMQLLAHSDLLDPVPTLTHLAFLLCEALRNAPLPESLFGPDVPRFQIRFVKASP